MTPLTPPFGTDLQRAHGVLARAADRLEQLPVKRRARNEVADLVLDLDCEIGKIRDTLCVYGLPDPGERSSSALAQLERIPAPEADR